MRHFHVHVIPRFRGDAISKFIRAMLGSVGFEKAERQNLDQIAKKLKKIFEKKDANGLASG